MPPNTIYVGRGSKFGNPFMITEDRNAREAVAAFRLWLEVDGVHSGIPEKKAAILDNLDQLKGKDLACWCKDGATCHADILLEFANRHIHESGVSTWEVNDCLVMRCPRCNTVNEWPYDNEGDYDTAVCHGGCGKMFAMDRPQAAKEAL